jgi:hypothetical protein
MKQVNTELACQTQYLAVNSGYKLASLNFPQFLMPCKSPQTSLEVCELQGSIDNSSLANFQHPVYCSFCVVGVKKL